MQQQSERAALADPMGPLAGLKILDFTQFQNGPQATVMLSDMGADVL